MCVALVKWFSQRIIAWETSHGGGYQELLMYILGSYVSLSLLLDMEKYDLTRRS